MFGRSPCTIIRGLRSHESHLFSNHSWLFSALYTARSAPTVTGQILVVAARNTYVNSSRWTKAMLLTLRQLLRSAAFRWEAKVVLTLLTVVAASLATFATTIRVVWKEVATSRMMLPADAM